MAKRQHLQEEQKKIVRGQIEDLKLMLLPMQEEQEKIKFEIEHNVEYLKLKYGQNSRKIARIEMNIKALQLELKDGRIVEDSPKKKKEVKKMSEEETEKTETEESEEESEEDEDSEEDEE